MGCPKIFHEIEDTFVFRSTRIYSPLSADEVRLRLIAQRGYSDIELPCTRTLRNKLNDFGYQLTWSRNFVHLS
ncbi:MAG: hypothetical protein KZQ66_15195 [Candidatus Thiodiazotropha sp. (ex Lucinoma aequizonata)]|nr:hypothetical protein [Candidatus Thiodiazotropha sp. (ex Lucinoma aequizonata)]MCU7895453.1 hypothetical protein [Candidatus Thiodiazotropha sp. (ex Lucinoma aequizonata)]MCU7899049.1 hypothetical protein [Candidatus Thiodiazotropha sp. (ex Lucinoma aequizonata)]MCU7903172.1 hypothetical protein [Candidatus Thiodiazotropha sp. (ex Lucinoma aequizonata)]MCU7911951.1 hypothetical protein [Candidatus Thiodiazotropha sp. (ex Lucinoma aequizonata)]